MEEETGLEERERVTLVDLLPLGVKLLVKELVGEWDAVKLEEAEPVEQREVERDWDGEAVNEGDEE